MALEKLVYNELRWDNKINRNFTALDTAVADVAGVKTTVQGVKTDMEAMKTTYLTANNTLYVTKAGNDTSGEGTRAKPFLTIRKALEVMPKNLNGYNAIISIGAGTYAEGITVSQFHNGMITIQGEQATGVIVSGYFTVDSDVVATVVRIHHTGRIAIKERADVTFVNGSVNVGTSNVGIETFDHSKVILSTFALKNCGAGVAMAAKGAKVDLYEVTQSGCIETIRNNMGIVQLMFGTNRANLGVLSGINGGLYINTNGSIF